MMKIKCKFCGNEIEKIKEHNNCPVIVKLVNDIVKEIKSQDYPTKHRTGTKPYAVDILRQYEPIEYPYIDVFKNLFKDKICEWVKQQLQLLLGNEHIKFRDFIQEYTRLLSYAEIRVKRRKQ